MRQVCKISIDDEVVKIELGSNIYSEWKIGSVDFKEFLKIDLSKDVLNHILSQPEIKTPKGGCE